MRTNRITSVLAAALLIPVAALAQQREIMPVRQEPLQQEQVQQKSDKKSFTLRGVVEGVDAKAGRLTVNHEKVEGWMAAMTMAYAVDKPADLEKVKVGDKIEATVYQDEYKLYDIKVTGKK